MVDNIQTDIASPRPAVDRDNSFVLKHRLAGSAFLLFFGALVLPWLLGPPSAASKTTTTVTQDTSDGQISSAEIENELLDELENNADVEPEQVYISKITPLDAERLEEERRRAEVEKKSKSSAAALAVADVGKSANDTKANNDSDKSKADEKESTKKDVTEDKVAKASTNKSPDNSKPSAQKASDKAAEESKKVAKKPADAATKTDKIASVKDKTNDIKTVSDSRDNALSVALAAESGSADVTNANVDVGWIVQVGVFTNKNGADRVVKDLKTKGFKPSATIIETNQGKGTRVWLGPFAQRVDAAKTKTRLKDRTGEDGFLKAYP